MLGVQAAQGKQVHGGGRVIHPSEVSAVLVTRGNVDMTEITDSITAAGIEDIVLWDNSKREQDLSCYGRYAGIAEAKNEYIFHQDDDLVTNVPGILDAYHPVRDRWAIVANNRIDEEWPLTAIGVLFHRDLADCFDVYTDLYGFDSEFFRVCDVVFAYQHPYRRVVLGYQDLPWHSDPQASMYLENGHMHVRIEARQRTLALPQRVLA